MARNPVSEATSRLPTYKFNIPAVSGSRLNTDDGSMIPATIAGPTYPVGSLEFCIENPGYESMRVCWLCVIRVQDPEDYPGFCPA